MDTKRRYKLLSQLRQKDMKPEKINKLSNEIMNIVGINTIVQFGAQLCAMQSQIAALAEIMRHS